MFLIACKHLMTKYKICYFTREQGFSQRDITWDWCTCRSDRTEVILPHPNCSNNNKSQHEHHNIYPVFITFS